MPIWRVFSTHDTRLIHLFTSLFSIILSFLKPIFPIHTIIQFGIFFCYKAIKFGEYNHQWYCKVICKPQVPSAPLKWKCIGICIGKVFAKLKNGHDSRELVTGLTFASLFAKELEFCISRRARTLCWYAVPLTSLGI